MRSHPMPDAPPTAVSWDLAAKVAAVTVAVWSLIRWAFTPLFVHVVRKALAPELQDMRDATESTKAVQARLDAHDRELAQLHRDVRELREWSQRS